MSAPIKGKPISWLTAKQYTILLNLYHELNAEFYHISESVQDEFFDILLERKVPA